VAATCIAGAGAPPIRSDADGEAAMSDEVLLDIDGAVARLTLNRPSAMNALNLAMLAGLEQHVPRLAADPDVRVVVLTGSGRAFCTGADLKEALASEPRAPGEPDFLARAAAVLRQLRELPKPLIAALNGITMAGGLELALCADIVVAAEGARIGDAHSNYGVYPGAGGAALLPRVVPQNVALYLLLTGQTLSAAEMKQYGFVNEVHPDAELGAAVARLATALAAKSPLVLRRMKDVARHSGDKTRDDALLHEQVMLRQHLASYDIGEGLRAFSEKRAPQFKGY
jgi:enoyl-CoA hydratase/carnithine racemase